MDGFMVNKGPRRYRRAMSKQGRYKKDVIKKKRICLKCEREFISINGDRLCNNCHDSNAVLADMAEGYVGGLLVQSGSHMKSKKTHNE